MNSKFDAFEDEAFFLGTDDYDTTMQDVLRLNPCDLWGLDRELPVGVILQDRLMTDAALGPRPIKTEHSYSLQSDGVSLPNSPSSIHKVEDMDDECFPVISMRSEVHIKDEPTSESDISPHSSCPSSPQCLMNPNDLQFDVEMATESSTILKSNNKEYILSSPHTIIPQRIQLPKMSIKVQQGNAFHLPPTPPSCSSSEESEDSATISQPASPAARKSNTARMVLHHHTTTRQPIHTHLISSQPKGSTGTLILTEEEKRTLIAEGYAVPTRLPLTKSEEKSLKKIRRKIKNKISAQESRRKKKEYMDQLERKVEILVSENNEYRQKIDDLEDSNVNLMSQLQKLQAIIAKTHPQFSKQLKHQ